ncbi:NHLP leader peptide family natural product precursor [Candidatus Methylospira mobilis]|uniref:NHLP leader peptide family natural product n=2 Tax=Candidatus Methylospira mobilis TaxID=1808979 RepID=A0A5Q0BS28_9GAMM|nr:NHLP leader peptide family natural product precursor [Candidatus Methylospira mobilis]
MQQEQKMQQVIAKCWQNSDFKTELMAKPEETLRNEGVELQAGVSVKVVEDTENLLHLVIPCKPAELSEEELDDIVGGAGRIRAASTVVIMAQKAANARAVAYAVGGALSALAGYAGVSHFLRKK